MLPRQYRLKNKYAFTATYHVKHSYHTNGVTLFVGKAKTNDTPTKIGFVVSKKTHKRAVKRNRLKRLMRENVRLFLKEQNVGNSQKYMSLIFVGHDKALGKSFTQMKTIVSDLLKKVRNNSLNQTENRMSSTKHKIIKHNMV